jgi:hypothetical protein
MAHTVCLQDWITITAASTNQIIIQPEPDWLDISDYQDIAAYLEVSQTSVGNNLVNVNLQSSPTKDESFFAAQQSGSNPFVIQFAINGSTYTPGVQPIGAQRWSNTSNNGQMPARYLRWQLKFAVAGNITFRIWLVLNQSGWRGSASVGPMLAAMNRANFG